MKRKIFLTIGLLLYSISVFNPCFGYPAYSQSPDSSISGKTIVMIKIKPNNIITHLRRQPERKINPFYIGAYEITVAEFATFIKAAGYITDVEQLGTNFLFDSNSHVTKPRPTGRGVSWRHNELGILIPPFEYNRPVIHISWNDAMAYCRWLSSKTGDTYRLPTEAEWEYVAKVKRKSVNGYSWGETEPLEKCVGNVRDRSYISEHSRSKLPSFNNYLDGHIYAAPVGSYESNRRGIHDLTGNVWEWCMDLYDDPDTITHSSYRSIRGGSWNSSPEYSTITTKGNCHENSSSFDIGFRVVMIPNKKRHEE